MQPPRRDKGEGDEELGDAPPGADHFQGLDGVNGDEGRPLLEDHNQ